MKTILKYILIFLLVLQSCNQKNPGSEESLIYLSGNIENIADTTLEFSFDQYSLLADNKKVEVMVDSQGRFDVILETQYPLKGFLSFGKVPKTYYFNVTQLDGKDSSMQVPSVDFRMIYLYLSPGDSLNLSADADQIENTLTFSGQGADNNFFINKEEWTFNDYKSKYLKNYYTLTYLQPDAYKSAKDELLRKQKIFLQDFQKEHHLNDHLVKVYQNQYEQEYIRALIYYPDGHAGFNQGQFPLLPDDYYNFMDEVILPQSIDDLGSGVYYFLNSFLRKKYSLAQDKTGVAMEFYEFADKQLPERLAFIFKAYALDRDFKKELYDAFDESCPYPDIADLVKKKYSHLEGMLEGSPGPDFELKDVDGQIHKLSDFKGNLVYIDFWATWCKPCIAEIPYLEKLQEELEGENIKFISISIDSEKDTLMWKNFVVEHEMKGIQLWADEKHHDMFSKNLNIKSIPRFVLIDKEGKIINAQAARPSDPGLIDVLTEVLVSSGQ